MTITTTQRCHAMMPARALLALPLVLFALMSVPISAQAGYAFSISGASASATGDSGSGPLYLAESGGFIYHSTDGVNFSNDWSGTGTTLSASSSSTITVTVSSGDGSVVYLGYNVLTPASALKAHIIVQAPANTADRVVIEDSISTSPTAYSVNTASGSISATGINFDTSTSAHPLGGGITLQGANAGGTFTLSATKSGEPLDLVGGSGTDTFDVPGPTLASTFNSATTLGGGGGTNTLSFAGTTDALAVTLSAGSVTGVTNLSTSNIQTLVGGSASDTITVVPGATAQSVDGGDPAPPASPGDRLTVDTSATTTPAVTASSTASGYQGQFTFGNAAQVSFKDIESLSPALDTSDLSATCTVGVACTVPFVLNGTGTAPFSLTAGAAGLPAGITLDTTNGALTGTPTTFGTYSSAVTVTDAQNATVSGTVAINVQQGSQTITGLAANPSNPSYSAGGTFSVSATASSGLQVAFSTSTSSVCQVGASSGTAPSTATVTMLAVGTCTIAANQAGDANYAAAPQVTLNVGIQQGSQTITGLTASPSNPTYSAGGTFSVSATASSGLQVAFSTSTPSVCRVGTSSGTAPSTATVTMLTTGTCTIAANQAGDANYAAAPQVTLNVFIAMPAPMPVPTLGRWMTLLLAALLCVVTFITLKRCYIE